METVGETSAQLKAREQKYGFQAILGSFNSKGESDRNREDWITLAQIRLNMHVTWCKHKNKGQNITKYMT